VANTANTVEVPARSVLAIGGRYRFTIAGKRSTLRAFATNIFGRYGWSVVTSDAYVFSNSRRWSVYLATDL